MRCPCRKTTETTSYATCCQSFHLGLRVAPTAETLMRSRYSAFALQDAGYLKATWHVTTRPHHIEFNPGQVWLSLRVLAASIDGATATVEFVARSRIGGSSHALHEISRFSREGEQWFYCDGLIK